MAANGSPTNRERIIEDEMTRIKPSLHRMLNNIEETFADELNRQRAEQEAKIAGLQAIRADLEIKLAESQTRLAHLGTLEQMHIRLEQAESRLVKMDALEAENRALRKELDAAKVKWTGLVHDGWGETASEKERYRLKLERAEAQLLLAKEQAKAARKMIKKAGLILKSDDGIPDSGSTISSTTSTSVMSNHHRRQRRNEKRKA
ncbi:hypothetical protein Moror_9583 [Moniliophthora roreri MCA 2997]|uniref:Uncharacterized protein n=1 Tax=Moniliophthora roreri (strain MCA 2997) TaxID=1381753 RepID=V2YHB5_MONRO|nr:hypothetical protein Moror_9583 [Moniliophthora roreri MCA 2997]